jgi:negative modulator of initiation of replication
MRNVELEDDVYAHLLQNVGYIGEDASSILRRLLGLSSTACIATDVMGVTAKANGDWLTRRLEDGEFLSARTATDKYLAVLGYAYEHDPEAFTKLFRVGGRKRKYFAASESAIATSGQATYPQPIPGSPYWAMTNASTSDKREILRQALQLLNCRAGAIERVCHLIA